MALGYWNRPDLTAAAFQTLEDGRRRHLTGDLAQRLPEGGIDYIGRRDDQIKLYGLRIEPAEIESALRSLPEAKVREAAVVRREDQPDRPYLAAYLVSDWRPTAFQLHRLLAEHLPHDMIPKAVVHLDAFPLTPSGKLDRQALPAPKAEHWRGGTEHVAAQTETELHLAALWQQVLNLTEPPGIHDDFFALGGHSLLATQVVSRISARFAMDLPLRTFFSGSTIAMLAAWLDQQRWQADAELDDSTREVTVI